MADPNLMWHALVVLLVCMVLGRVVYKILR